MMFVSGLYGDSINEMAWLVGETISTLKELNLHNNTLVFFVSDHGPQTDMCVEGGSTGGLRGALLCCVLVLVADFYPISQTIRCFLIPFFSKIDGAPSWAFTEKKCRGARTFLRRPF